RREKRTTSWWREGHRRSGPRRPINGYVTARKRADMETLLLDRFAVSDHAHQPEVIEAVEAAFAAYERGDATMPPKSYVGLPRYGGDFRSMPAYFATPDWDAAGLKWVNAHPTNPVEHDLPTVMGTMIYSEPETAFPLAI